MLLFLALVAFFLIRLNRSRFGRAIAAIRQDETVAATMGINIVYHKGMVFVMSAMLAAAAGVFSGHLTRIIGPNDFGFNRVVDVLAFAVLGGTNNWFGPIVGAMTLTGLPEVFRFLKQFNQVFNGLVLLLIIIYLPRGLADVETFRTIKRWLARRGGEPSSDTTGGQA